ncbi:shikimate 5-dehydrogenase [Bernardetia litoralis DSM 6794]|uniref:Shikimate 5-dehydrogenase n=1 Tax=Bernardetia litoralis (strain ATCC 23117 / DSM 6794 / NBRC 15988 / NCIMB 1366 / Fx l1 / Sio-4) TaxID=880071 RepID=I4AHW4_BERLS|nr:shikimate dehydrogenase [Bernardetia litoralis]AFM03549.1 shikimate 5-dehydrogenase [Bernardetia litoralis DSM 6794]
MFGLIGKKLSHSFSKNYFTEKFQKLGLSPNEGYVYELFELEKIEDFDTLIKENPSLRGLNVTIPYKKAVIPFLDKLDPIAKRIGAVNTIKIEEDGTKTGYNTDYIGFKSSLEKFIYTNSTSIFKGKALIFGTGGAAQAVKIALQEAEDLDDISRLNIKFDFVSSSVIATQDEGKYQIIPYSRVDITKYKLLINTTPLGMYPNIDDFPPLSSVDYSKIDKSYFLYDLVYNPEETLFLKKGKAKGAKTMNGLEMLHGQAEAAAYIWGI